MTKKRMTTRDWIRAEAMYESGEYSLDKIGEEFGVHKATIQRHMKEKGIEKGVAAAKVKEAVEKRIADDASEEVDITTQRIRETKERQYTLAATIDKRITREIIDAEREDRPISVATNNLKAYKLMAETLKLTRDAQYEVLGISDEDNDELPTLEVREMLEDEIAEIRDGQKEQAKEMGVLEEGGDE